MLHANSITPSWLHDYLVGTGVGLQYKYDLGFSAMIQSSTNLKLIDSLAQIILALSPEERQLLDQKIHAPQTDLSTFFDELVDLEPDLNQPDLEEISQVVREVRQELWTPQ